LAKKKKKTMGKVIGTMNLKENRTTFGWIKEWNSDYTTLKNQFFDAILEQKIA